MTRRLAVIAAMAMLAGCSNEQPAPPTPSESASLPGVPASAPPTHAANGQPSPALAERSIPQAIQGRWGLVAADCTSTNGDAKGLLVIDPARLRFYESVARLGKIAQRSPSRIKAGFALEGEGTQWSQDMELDLSDGGRTLTRREFGDEAAPGPFIYKRCD